MKSIEGIPGLTPEVRDELRALEARKDSEIDTSDPDAQDFSAGKGWG